MFKCTNRGAIVVVQYSSVLGKIDEILVWEQRKETERDTTFVQLGRYLREVWAGQY